MTRNPRPTVLVVEDNPDLRDTIHELLESESFACWTAESATDALRQLETRRERPDVILLDVVMPGMPAVDSSRASATTPRGSRRGSSS